MGPVLYLNKRVREEKENWTERSQVENILAELLRKEIQPEYWSDIGSDTTFTVPY